MTLLYEAVFVICTLNPLNPWIGDRDTGPTCVMIEKVAFPTEAQCLTRLEDTLKIMSTEAEQMRLKQQGLPGPYSYFTECRIPVHKDNLPCSDCDKKE